MQANATNWISPEDYLARERRAEGKSEYHDGVIVAMAGGGPAHSRLAVRLAGMLDQVGRRRGCSVFNSDMKVWITATRKYVYPDISALCEKAEFHDEHRDVLLNPSLVIEVLSKSSETYDRGVKLHHYTTVPSVREVLLVSQTALHVDKYTHQPDGIWRYEAISGAEGVLHFESLGCDVRLGDFYEGVELDPPNPEPER